MVVQEYFQQATCVINTCSLLSALLLFLSSPSSSAMHNILFPFYTSVSSYSHANFPPECTSYNSESCCRCFCFAWRDVTGQFESVWSSKCKLHMFLGRFQSKACSCFSPSLVCFFVGGLAVSGTPQTAAAGKPERQSVSKAGKGGKENSSRAGEKRKKELLVFVGANFSFLFSLSSPWRRIKKKEC